MLFQIKSYIKFLWHSKNEHAVHSPFVFSLITKCFYDKKTKPEYALLKKYGETALENKPFSKKRAKLLLRIVSYFNPKNILAVGNSSELTTLIFDLGNPTAKKINLETVVTSQTQAQFYLQRVTHTSTTADKLNFESSLCNLDLKTTNFNLIYFNGSRSKKAILDYFEFLLPTIDNDSLWIFDGIHHSQEMEEAWQFIQNHERVKVTIDTFQWGFVFFRREQKKEHFTIRA